MGIRAACGVEDKETQWVFTASQENFLLGFVSFPNNFVFLTMAEHQDGN